MRNAECGVRNAECGVWNAGGDSDLRGGLKQWVWGVDRRAEQRDDPLANQGIQADSFFRRLPPDNAPINRCAPAARRCGYGRERTGSGAAGAPRNNPSVLRSSSTSGQWMP